MHGRIIACGGISAYNDETPRPGPTNLGNIVGKRLTMKGFIVSDFLERRPQFIQEVGGYFRAGKLKNEETVVSGIEQAVPAFIGLFTGKNLGKMVVSLTPAVCAPGCSPSGDGDRARRLLEHAQLPKRSARPQEPDDDGHGARDCEGKPHPRSPSGAGRRRTRNGFIEGLN
jgi:hypothetical protein